MTKEKDPAAVELGRKGGLAGGCKGGKARMALLTPEQRSVMGREAVAKRLEKKKSRGHT